jgi:hypothetical protein
MMPLARYFVFVGGALMALLIAFDLCSPKAAADIGIHSGGNADKSTVRIHSEQKWPDRVVFDTTQPVVAPKQVQAAQSQATQPQAALTGPEAASEFTPKARVRETFAQFVPAEPKKPEAATAKKRKVARTGQPLRFAQQRYGFSTW